ncbi:MAG: tRNA (5-methylaminomethyl-2-thiouridine)(34)-methyltransferase MnmD [Saprospiraceae bacterium]|nr:tRNA (5-methylaminomethyl-2-thiouridine)(34)-methyltransferase MnmD [Saprospiraceae bacterium]
MNSADLSLVKTKDGSDSLFSARFQDSYHSLHGAIQESQHIFVDKGLDFVAHERSTIKLLELGFGTGLNLLLTLSYAEANPSIQISYQTIEAYPVSQDMIDQLNYTSLISGQWFDEIHQLPWNQVHRILPNLSLVKHLMLFEQMDFVDEFNLIYFDAFAPSKQPMLWQEEFLSLVSRSAKTGALLVTYCSQGAFRRSLIQVGFSIEKLAGPPGKREMVRARKL